VLTSDLYPERHAIAARFGLKDPINAGTENVVERVFAEDRWTRSRRGDFGRRRKCADQDPMDAVRPGGKVMLLPRPSMGKASFDPGACAW